MLVRFERAVALVKREPLLTSVALGAGYYDQSHFIREFHRVTGTSPGAFFRGGRLQCRIRPIAVRAPLGKMAAKEATPMATIEPDIFTNVHKGIRKALFEACIALGRAGDDEARCTSAKELLREALHFVEHHGDNEDALLLPLVEKRAPSVFERMTAAHGEIGVALDALIANIATVSTAALYTEMSRFVALYLEHMREEEQELDPIIRTALSAEMLSGFGRDSVARTSPADQKMMLGWMLPAMNRADVEAFLGRLPPAMADALRPMLLERGAAVAA